MPQNCACVCVFIGVFYIDRYHTARRILMCTDDTKDTDVSFSRAEFEMSILVFVTMYMLSFQIYI